MAPVLVCFGRLAVRSETKRDAMLHTLHLSNPKKRRTISSPLSKDRASRAEATSNKEESSDDFRYASVGCFIHGRHTTQAGGAGTAGLGPGSTCLQRKPLGGCPPLSSSFTPPQSHRLPYLFITVFIYKPDAGDEV